MLEIESKKVVLQYENILNNNIHMCGVKDDRIQSILKKLNFKLQAEHVINKICNQFEVLYSEYLKKESNEQSQSDISKRSLEIAEEANRISKQNFWVTGIISFVALIMSIVTFFYSCAKK